MIRPLPALLFFCSVAGAQDIDSGALLSRVQEKVRENARAIPRFVCRQKIERQEFFNAGRGPACGSLAERGAINLGHHPITTDRAVLDVMLSATEELFAWPGSRSFDVTSPDKLLGGGLSGSGDFATLPISIFTSDATTFEYQGSCGHEACVRFSYDVPQFASTQRVTAGLHEGVLGYHGTFDVDPQSADLLSLIVIPTDLAKELPEACAMRTTVTYAPQSADALQFIMPQATDREYVAKGGSGFSSDATYEGCREFESQSAISFTGDPDGGKAAQPGNGQPALPARGEELQVRLSGGIRSDAAAGDGLEGFLAKPVKDRQGGTLPEGAIFRGHITRPQTVHSPKGDRLNVSMRFDTLAVNGVAVPVVLTPVGTMDSREAAVFTFLANTPMVGKGLVSRWKVVQ